MAKSDFPASAQLSRRMLLVAAGAPLLAATDASANVKLSKTAVKFSTVASNGKTCGACKLFREPSACLFVEGQTDPHCTCWIWQAKSA